MVTFGLVVPIPSLEAHRRALLLAQGADPEYADPSIDRVIERDTNDIATAWATLIAFYCVVGAVFLVHADAWQPALAAPLVVFGVYRFVKHLGTSERTFDAALTEKFITRKKRRPNAVFAGRAYRVGAEIYALLEPGVRYRLHTNAAGALVLDVAPS